MEHQLKEFYAGKKVLVTGGAGFIGSHIVEELVALDAKVTVLDNFTTGSINNLRKVLPFISVQYADITAPYSLRQGVADKEIIFHLAAFVSVASSVKYPSHCALVNEIGTANLLHAAVKSGVKSVVFSSSAAVYGNKTTLCQEDDIPNPQSPYATSKLAGEVLCKEASINHKIATTCLRYFNVYGDRQSPSGEYAAVVAKFTQRLKAHEPVLIFGDGEQTRDFIHVSKVAQANLLAGMQLNNAGEVINVASGVSITLLQLLEQLEAELGIQKTNLLFEPSRDGDIKYSSASNEKLRHLLNASASISYIQGKASEELA